MVDNKNKLHSLRVYFRNYYDMMSHSILIIVVSSLLSGQVLHIPGLFMALGNVELNLWFWGKKILFPPTQKSTCTRLHYTQENYAQTSHVLLELHCSCNVGYAVAATMCLCYLSLMASADMDQISLWWCWCAKTIISSLWLKTTVECDRSSSGTL